MKSLFDTVSFQCSEEVTSRYSTSFYFTSRLLGAKIRGDIFNIYGFVRFADEIVDSFHGYQKEYLLDKFEKDTFEAIEQGISLNPILNSFQYTVNKYQIDHELIKAFLNSMRMDLHKNNYHLQSEYEQYIYGSADVVGLMCLMVFVNGDKEKYLVLKEPAMRLGSAFQKVNFLRDLKDDTQDLNRSYFPGVDFNKFDIEDKEKIIQEIEEDFQVAYDGIVQLPQEARLGVYTAYVFYSRLLRKLKKSTVDSIMETRVRIPNYSKFLLVARSFVTNKLNLI
jgi:phytoene/squalene synthetase